MQKKLHVLMISTDRNIFLPGSDAHMRMKEYAALVEELSIIVFAKESLGLASLDIAPNARAYPTNSWSRFLYISDAYTLAKGLFAPDFSGMDKFPIDVVTTQDPFETGLAGYRISRLLSRPLHLQVHTDLFAPAFRRSSFLNAVRVRIAKFLFRRGADIRVVSEHIRRSILHRMKFAFNKTPRITVLPVFVDTEKFINTPPSFDVRKQYPGFDLLMLTVARLEKEKNVLGAVRLVEELHHAKPELAVGLVVVGSGSEEKKLKAYTRKKRLEDRVFFVGRQSDMVSYYKTADVLLVTSEYEGYPLMFVEASASGCPILTFDVGSASDTLSSWNALICPEKDTKCLLENIANLASDHALRDTLIISARGAAKRLKFPTKEEYLTEYKRMWEAAADNNVFIPNL